LFSLKTQDANQLRYLVSHSTVSFPFRRGHSFYVRQISLVLK